MARLLALCSLPRTNPGDRKEYVQRNGPYTLGMTAGINNKLPYGNIPRHELVDLVETGEVVQHLGRGRSVGLDRPG